MRITLLQKIEKIVNLLEQYIKEKKRRNDELDSTDIIELCEEAILSIRVNLEERFDEAEVLGLYLDRCEGILDSLKQRKGEKKEYLLIVDELREFLKKSGEFLHYEALFLPYKASMWDCFDSVYHEVMKNEKWNATVVAVPYYNIGENREILSKEYEGDCFPSEIEVMHYDNYDITEHIPDVVFIHNPYDDCNLITQVSPEYFSSELKKVCKRLVYIPYYISDRMISYNQCLMPGPQNAWRIIAQNEIVKQQYLDYGRISEERVLALGSPKLDKVFEAMGTVQRPEEWRALDGKKVFLVNTHISKIIGDAELFLKRLEAIFNVFEAYEDAVLLWRPHPLSIQTAKSLNPGFLHAYLNLIERFKLVGKGVYDDTPEIERSIAIADAYIGESQSSVSQLFEVTQKPMYYVDDYIEEGQNDIRIFRGQCGELSNKCFYVHSYNSASILEYNLENQNTTIWNQQKRIENNVYCMFMRTIKHKENIYFLPGNVDYILKLNTITKEQIQIPLKPMQHDYNAVIFGKYMFLLPLYCVSEMPCLNLETEEAEYLPINYDMNMRKNVYGASLFIEGKVVGDIVYRGYTMAPVIQKFDLVNRRFSYTKVEGLTTGIYNLIPYKDEYWILSDGKNKIIKWDERKNVIIQNIDINTKYMNAEYIYMVNFGEKIVLLARNYPVLLVMNPIDNKIEVINYGELLEVQSQGAHITYNYCQDVDALFLFTNYVDGVIKIDLDFTITLLPTKVSMESMLMLQKNQIYTNGMCTIEKFIEIVKQKEPCTSVEKVLYGERIWETIRRDTETEINQ